MFTDFDLKGAFNFGGNNREITLFPNIETKEINTMLTDGNIAFLM